MVKINVTRIVHTAYVKERNSDKPWTTALQATASYTYEMKPIHIHLHYIALLAE